MSSLHLWRNEEEAGLINWANGITLLRLLLAPPIVLYFWHTDHRLAAAIALMIGFGTDFIDGIVARRYDQETKFGKKFDPVCDAILMFIALWITVANIEGDTELGLVLAIIIVSLIIAGLTTYYDVVRKYAVTVTWAGKKSMFFRMTGIAWLLMTVVDSTPFYDVFSRSLGIFAGFLGIAFAVPALWQYIAQESKRVDPQAKNERSLYPLGWDKPLARFLLDPFGLKKRFNILRQER